MGLVRLFRHWDWEGAYRSFQKALSLTPGSAEVHQLYGTYLRTLGDMEATLDEFQAALQLDPLSLPIRLSHAEALMFAGDLERAQDELEKMLEEDPSFRAAAEQLGTTKILAGDVEGALELFESLPLLSGHRYAGAAVRGYAFALLGRRDEALEMLELLEERARDHPEVPLSFDFALVHHGLGDHDRAFEYLDEAADQKLGILIFLYANPFWNEELRADDRFDALLERIGHPKSASV